MLVGDVLFVENLSKGESMDNSQNYVSYNDLKSGKEYKLYYNDIDLTVLIDDGKTKHVVKFSQEEPTSNVISRFEELCNSPYIAKPSKEEEEVDTFLARFKDGGK